MRGDDIQQTAMFSYLSPEQRVPADHPLRAIRQICDKVLAQLSGLFATMYSEIGRPSVAPEKLLRALLLQVLYTVRSERMLMEQLDYNLLFRWFVGLNMDEAVWHVTVYTKNRDRLLEADVAKEFFRLVVEQAIHVCRGCLQSSAHPEPGYGSCRRERMRSSVSTPSQEGRRSTQRLRKGSILATHPTVGLTCVTPRG